MLRYRAYRAMRDWPKSDLGEGYFTPLPREVREFQEAVAKEEAMPLTASWNGDGWRIERPADAPDDRTEPDVEKLVRHGAKNLPSSESVHMSPNIILGDKCRF